MEDHKIKLEFVKLSKALITLEEAAAEPLAGNRYTVDSTLIRFTYTIDLFWKLLKIILQSRGVIDLPYPKDVLQKAYQGHLIDNEKTWLKMVDDRNNIVHSYDEDVADTIYAHIKSHIPVLRKTFDTLLHNFQK